MPKASKFFTVSQLESCARCPQEYLLKYHLALPARGLFTTEKSALPANVSGSIVHAVLARSGSGEDTARAINAEFLANGLIPDAELTREIESLVKTARRLSAGIPLSSGRRELDFRWRFGDHTIIGSIDWLITAGDTMEIVDFKTDGIDASGVAERAAQYELQMICYALAAEEATGLSASSAKLFFLRPERIFTYVIDEEFRRSGRKKLDDIIGRITRNDLSISRDDPPCQKCPFHNNGMCWEDRCG